MKRACCLIASVVALFATPLGAVEEGTGAIVREVSGESVTLDFAGPAPKVGDAVEFFFEIGGDMATVATGKVSAVDEKAGSLKAKIEKATGSVDKGQLARFASSAGPSTTSSSPMPRTPVTATSPLATRSIVGHWVRQFDPPSIIFKEDGKVEIEDATGVIRGKFRTDTTTTPHRLEIFGFDQPDIAGPSGKIIGFYQLESGTRARVALDKPESTLEDFANSADYVTRVGRAPAMPTLVGEWKKDIASQETYTFGADGMVRTVTQLGNDPPREKQYRYRIDGSTSPRQIDFYFLDGLPDADFRGIVEFEGDALKLEGRWTIEESERPKNFSENAEIYRRSE